MVCYIVVDDQKNKGERLGKYSKLPLERKLIFDFFFFLLKKAYGTCKHHSARLILEAMSIQVDSLNCRFSLTTKKCYLDEPLEISCSKFWVLDIFPC